MPSRVGLLRPSPHLIAAIAVLLFYLPAASGAEIQLYPQDDRIIATEAETTLKAGLASIQVYCSVKNAKLSIDRKDAGWLPYSGDLEPGSHYLEVTVPGYYSLGNWFILGDKKLYTIDFAPTRITGFVDIKVEPEDASIRIDGSSEKAGKVELPVGAHRLLVRRFGYIERSMDLVVAEKAGTPVSVALETAPFEIKGLRFSRKAFNPRNLGVAGRTSLDFTATNYGSARAEILGPDGAPVAALEYPAIEDWDQAGLWDGLGPGGESLPDGLYTAKLVATAKEGGLIVEAEARVRIDSTIVIGAFGTASGTPGLLYMPDPVPESAGTVATEAFCFIPLGGASGSPLYPAFGISGAMSMGGIVTLALQASAETSSGPVSSGDVAGSALVSLFGDKASAWSGAFFARGGYSSTLSPSMPGALRAVDASLPIAARLGELAGGDLRIALAPGARADFSSATAFLGLMRGALWLEARAFRAGLSAELPLGLSSGKLEPAWPAKAALEGRFMLGGSPFVAAAYAAAELSPNAGPAFGIGFGLGLLF